MKSSHVGCQSLAHSPCSINVMASQTLYSLQPKYYLSQFYKSWNRLEDKAVVPELMSSRVTVGIQVLLTIMIMIIIVVILFLKIMITVVTLFLLLLVMTFMLVDWYFTAVCFSFATPTMLSLQAGNKVSSHRKKSFSSLAAWYKPQSTRNSPVFAWKQNKTNAEIT